MALKQKGKWLVQLVIASVITLSFIVSYQMTEKSSRGTYRTGLGGGDGITFLTQVTESGHASFSMFIRHHIKSTRRHPMAAVLVVLDSDSHEQSPMSQLLDQLQASGDITRWIYSSHDKVTSHRLHSSFYQPPPTNRMIKSYKFDEELGAEGTFQGRYSDTMLLLLEQCQTIYCVHLDSDMLVYGGKALRTVTLILFPATAINPKCSEAYSSPCSVGKSNKLDRGSNQWNDE